MAWGIKIFLKIRKNLKKITKAEFEAVDTDKSGFLFAEELE